ncbi:MAG: HEAT repeat domain-containing protein [Candidatus Krumholzibacteria bacterium]
MDKSADRELLDPGTAADDLRGLDKVRVVLQALSKLMAGKRTYAKNNPTLIKFSKDFDAAFQAFFADEDELVLTVEQWEIKWRDTVVYQNDKIDESLAFLMYKDGIGEITFQQSVTPEQLDIFVDLLKDELHNFSPDEDVVTKFWKSDFADISYRVLDEYLVGEFGEGRLGEDHSAQRILQGPDHPDLPSFADKGRVIVTATDPIDSISEYLLKLLAASGTDTSDQEEQFQNMLESFFSISSEELKLCQQEIQAEKRRDRLVWFLDVILDFTLLKGNPPAVRDVSNVVECIVDFVITEGKLAGLNEALQTIRRFPTEHSVPVSLEPFLKKLEARFAETPLLMSLGQTVERFDKNAEDLFAFYRVVGKRAVPTICSLLEDLQGSRLHVEACETLIAIDREEIAQIVEKLNIDNPKIAQDVIYLTRAMNPEQIPDLIRQLMYYPDRNVRADVIKYLAEKPGEDRAILLVQLMDDEDKHIRMKTLSAVEEFQHPIIANKVAALAFEKELGQKGFDEQEQVFKVAGKLAGDDMLPRVREMLDKKSLFGLGKGHGKQGRLLAVRALEQIGGPEAAGILEDLAQDKDTLVKAKAQRALRANEQQLHSQAAEEQAVEKQAVGEQAAAEKTAAGRAAQGAAKEKRKEETFDPTSKK